jgi:hypothetical protein
MPNRVWRGRERRPRRRPRRGRGWGSPRRGRLRRRLGLGCVSVSGRRGGFGRVLDGRGAGRRRGRRGGRRRGCRRARGEARRRRERRRGGSVADPQRDRERDAHPGEGQDAREDGNARPEAHLLHAGVQHAPEPAGPAGPLTHDKARYMGIRSCRIGRPGSGGLRSCPARRSGAWPRSRSPRQDRHTRSRRSRRSAPWSRRTARR